VYTNFNIKWSFLAAVVVFAAGSLICVLAPTSAILIFRRAFAGCGSAGILTGAFVVVAHSVRLQKDLFWLQLLGWCKFLKYIAHTSLNLILISRLGLG
jgi:MFS family permease